MLAAPWPKRRVTIFTSSGCETSLGIGHLSSIAIALKNAGHVIGSQVIVEVVVDLDGGGPAAGADAFHFFKREDAVCGHALVAHAELFLEALEERIRPAQHAAYVGAHLDVEFTCRLKAQHRVVGGHVASQ